MHFFMLNLIEISIFYDFHITSYLHNFAGNCPLSICTWYKRRESGRVKYRLVAFVLDYKIRLFKIASFLSLNLTCPPYVISAPVMRH